jgi:hypothetical protein
LEHNVVLSDAQVYAIGDHLKAQREIEKSTIIHNLISINIDSTHETDNIATSSTTSPANMPLKSTPPSVKAGSMGVNYTSNSPGPGSPPPFSLDDACVDVSITPLQTQHELTQQGTQSSTSSSTSTPLHSLSSKRLAKSSSTLSISAAVWLEKPSPATPVSNNNNNNTTNTPSPNNIVASTPPTLSKPVGMAMDCSDLDSVSTDLFPAVSLY